MIGRLPAMLVIFGGGVLVVAGIAARVIASGHPPLSKLEQSVVTFNGGVTDAASWHLSQTAYDLMRIGAWALLVFGALVVTIGLIRYWTRRRALVA